jgi:ring-1,2-phenylacetyl-CoA epoxidase subunit PaaC
MATASITVSETPLVLYTLRRADDALILGHRLSEWCGHAPMLEEDMALANMGLDLLGQARELYAYAAKVEGKDNDEDKFAYLRDVRQYRIFCWSNSRTAISPAPWCGSSSMRYSPISIGAR